MRRVPRPLRAAGAFLVAVVSGVAVATERGDALGLVALVFFAGVYVTTAVRWDETIAWSRRHPLADTALMAPLVFFATAAVTSVPLLVCAALSVPLTAAVMAMRLRQNRRAAS